MFESGFARKMKKITDFFFLVFCEVVGGSSESDISRSPLALRHPGGHNVVCFSVEGYK